jgi:hypothetical protein
MGRLYVLSFLFFSYFSILSLINKNLDYTQVSFAMSVSCVR